MTLPEFYFVSFQLLNYAKAHIHNLFVVPLTLCNIELKNYHSAIFLGVSKFVFNTVY